jgi:roadblock/LC7 domain-containing protein
MVQLDDLLRINGVIAAGQFTPDGRALEYRAKVDRSFEMHRQTSRFTALVTMMFDTLASAYGLLSRMNWLPQRFWTYVGGDWRVAAGQNTWAFVQTDKADFNRLYQALSAEE